MEIKINSIQDLDHVKQTYQAEMAKYHHQVLVCAGAGCISSNCYAVRDAVADELAKMGMSDSVKMFETGCMGTCAVGPVILILPERIFYTDLNPDNVRKVLRAHLQENKVLEEHTFYDSALGKHIPKIDDIPFFKEQVRIALRNCGVIEYANIDSYIANDGYYAACKAITGMEAGAVVEEMKASGLRGRGGGGFPTGVKWEAGYKAPGQEKYIVCNADEGDPGAFMDRSVIEGDPHNLIEGMMLGGYAIGATKGYVYIRAEYPIAVDRLGDAIAEARKYGLLGCKLFGSDFEFDLEIRIGAGAFVCGEETSLMASIEGQRGEPRQKPPFPFQRGLFGKPTIINNVETFANVPAIILNGAAEFAKIGTEKAKGTKVFALAGDIVNSGIIEVPIGTSMGHIIFNIGGGLIGGKKFKSAQVGGPSGGCITADNLNVPMEYDALLALGAMMGSGGLIAMNEDTCMVDTARFFMDFIQDESCGKCTACRIGTKRMLEILERITQGHGEPGDIDLLLEIGTVVKDSAMCGLGQTAPNPILSTIRYFRDEYEEHINKKYCRAGVCSDLYSSPCENTCPAGIRIPGYMSLIATNNFIDAYRVMMRDNPFSGICGRICTHPCENRCRRATVDEALAICELKRFVTDQAYAQGYPHDDELLPLGKKDKKVAIIGAGPAGLTCGYYLARLGYEVDAFEAEKVAGGVLLYGIPEYRLPKKIVAHEISIIERAGVKIHLNTKVGRDISFAQLREQYDAIFIGVGAQTASKLRIEGEDLEGVYHGLDFLKRNALVGDLDFTGKKVAVIGGGNTAIDSARTSLRLGAKEVKIIYRRDFGAMPAAEEEIEDALAEGVKIETLINPVRFIGEGGKLKAIEIAKQALHEFDSSGRRKARPIEGSEYVEEFDIAIPAVSQAPDTGFVADSGVEVSKWQSIVANADTMATSADGIFTGGDAYRGPEDVVHAIHDAKLAAASIDKYLGGEGVLYKGAEVEITDYHEEGDIVEHMRFPKTHLPAEKAKESFSECNLGMHKLNAIAESMRCLRCDRR
ncbi:MAG: NADH-ubiquinone oxidoreductase-F iron-sulfur binding region domain-containing protein [Bacillota bacterium]|nr:NADH-ubiquinone oxidoreductase-F iron-sulfur binding region domain-containing protein [Bacillota bacterium]